MSDESVPVKETGRAMALGRDLAWPRGAQKKGQQIWCLEAYDKVSWEPCSRLVQKEP